MTTKTPANLGQVAADTAIQTLTALTPALLTAGAAGAASASPAAATIEALMPSLLTLLHNGQLTQAQVTQIVTATATQVETNQQVIDAYAKSKGVTDPVAPKA